jgi:prepilin-type N-terminal cleavage/methylation domain-containing protein
MAPDQVTIVSGIYNNTTMKHTRRGFTMIELLVTVTMIAVLTVIGVVSYSSVNKRSRDAKRKSDLEQLRSAMEMFRSDYNYYPGTTGAWVAASGLDTDLVSTYMPAIASDPQEPTRHYYFRAKNYSAVTTHYYGYCVCTCLESTDCAVIVSNTCDAGDVRADCNYYLKNP